MTPALLCLVAATARAARFVRHGDTGAAPSHLAHLAHLAHPAFTWFRRMNYVWVAGAVIEPVSDDVGLWLGFLGERGAGAAWLDVTEGDGLCRIVSREGPEEWRCLWDGGAFTLRGERAAATAPCVAPDPDPGEAGAALRRAAAEALTASPPPTRAAALQRTLAILDSRGDGEEVSDVSWQYRVLPSGYPEGARRLLAAACAAWPEAASPLAPEAPTPRGDAMVEAALSAIAAAVNSTATHEPVE